MGRVQVGEGSEKVGQHDFSVKRNCSISNPQFGAQQTGPAFVDTLLVRSRAAAACPLKKEVVMPVVRAAPRPKSAIRRFDVFAEYKRQEAVREGQAADQAKGYGLWVAKVVAARRFGKKPKPDDGADGKPAAKQRRGKWRKLDDKPQTDKLFDKEIVSRMGVTFYQRVFAPAIRRAIAEGRRYEDIRDSLRAEWKPAA